MHGTLVYRMVTQSIKFTIAHLQKGEERLCESLLSENTTQCPRPGPFDPEVRALTVKPPRLHKTPFSDLSIPPERTRKSSDAVCIFVVRNLPVTNRPTKCRITLQLTRNLSPRQCS